MRWIRDLPESKMKQLGIAIARVIRDNLIAKGEMI